MNPPLILVIDDNPTTRKVVETYLTQASYRIVTAANAERGLELAAEARPDLILLDHQLPGTTGDLVCRDLLKNPVTAAIPVVICSAMRSKAFVQYAEFPNVVDQIPKPFTPELLKSGVANALQTGALVVRAQQTGSALPESFGEEVEPTMQGVTSLIPIRAIFDFLCRVQVRGRLTIDYGNDRLHFALASGRIQAVYAPSMAERIEALLPSEFEDFAPVLPITVAEHQDAQTSRLLKLLGRNLADPKRLRALLRFQSSVIAYWALSAEPGRFRFDAGVALPPMFQAIPLNISLAALAVEGVQRVESIGDPEAWASIVLQPARLRVNYRDAAGLSPTALQLHAALDGTRDLGAIARESGLKLSNVVVLARGLELAGLVDRYADASLVLVMDSDPEAINAVEDAVNSEGARLQLKTATDLAGAQLLLRRANFHFVILPLDRPEHEADYLALRAQSSPGTRFVGLTGVRHEDEIIRLDSMGIDALIERPIRTPDVLATLHRLLEAQPAAAAGA